MTPTPAGKLADLQRERPGQGDRVPAPPADDRDDDRVRARPAAARSPAPTSAAVQPGAVGRGEQDGRRGGLAPSRSVEPVLDRGPHVGRARRRGRPRSAPAAAASAARIAAPAASAGGATTTTGVAPPSRKRGRRPGRSRSGRRSAGSAWAGPSARSARRRARSRRSSPRPAVGRRLGSAAASTGRAWAPGPSGPRLRRAISSATMLMAISGTVCEPMSSPTGAATRARAASAMPARGGPRRSAGSSGGCRSGRRKGRPSGPGGRAPPGRGRGRG